MDLLDRHRGRLSSRRLAVLVRHLPRDSAVHRELYGEAADWAVTDHLLAAAVDHLAAANWMFARVNSDEDADATEPPAPLPRPDGTRRDPEADRDRARDPDPAPDPHPQRPSAAELLSFFG